MGLRLLPAAVITALALSACGGGSTGSSPMSIPTNSPTNAPTSSPAKAVKATGSISFRVPIAGKQKLSLAHLGKKPQFVSPATSSGTFYFDGVGQSFSVSNPPSGAQNIGAANSGQTATYGSVATNAYYQVTVTLSVIPGVHQIGVLLEDTNSYVLSEAQAPFTFQAGAGNQETLTLNGVLASGDICDAGCDGTLGTPTVAATAPTATAPAAAAIYTLYAIPTDFDGWAIPDQGGLPFDNGSFTIVSDNPSVVNIVNPGPFTSPGTDDIFQTPLGNVTTGHEFTVQCLTTGSADLEMMLGSPATAAAPFAGFTYTQGTNYPTAGQLLGGSATINCTASGNLIVD